MTPTGTAACCVRTKLGDKLAACIKSAGTNNTKKETCNVEARAAYAEAGGDTEDYEVARHKAAR